MEEEVEGDGGVALFEDAETGLFGLGAPPGGGAEAAVEEERAEGEAEAGIISGEDEEEVAARFEDAVGFAEGLDGALPREVIDGIGAEEGVEGGVRKREAPHVGRDDRDAGGEAGGVKVALEEFAGVLGRAEVPGEGLGKEVEGDEFCMRAGAESHDGGAAGAGAEVEDAALARGEEGVGGERGRGVHAEGVEEEEGSGSPGGEEAEEGHEPAGPMAKPGGGYGGEHGEEDDEVAVGEPPGVGKVEGGLSGHGSMMREDG